MKTRECDLWADIAVLIKQAPELLEEEAGGLCSVLTTMESYNHSIWSVVERAKVRVRFAVSSLYLPSYSPAYLHNSYVWDDGVRLKWARKFMRESGK